jgi:lipopolysaccharide heptosyltransferase I
MSERILLVRLSAVGDVVNVLPALTLLRRARPHDYLAFAVEDRAADVVRDHPLLDEVIVFPRRRWRAALRVPAQWRSLVREVSAYRGALRAGRFDVALDFQGNLKGAAHALLSGAPRRIGFARGHDREGSHLFATEHVVPPADRPHRVDKFAALVGALGATGAEREYVLPTSEAARASADRLLAAEAEGEPGSGGARRALVVLHPGTSGRGTLKRWPAERFAELARRLRTRRGARTLITWGPGEEALAGAVHELSGAAAEIAPRTQSLLELAEILRRAAVFVAADTGPMHLAAACGTRCVALFGPKDPAVYAPYGAGHVVVRRAAGEGAGTMEAIGVDEVFAAVASQLDRMAPPSVSPPVAAPGDAGLPVS